MRKSPNNFADRSLTQVDKMFCEVFVKKIMFILGDVPPLGHILFGNVAEKEQILIK